MVRKVKVYMVTVGKSVVCVTVKAIKCDTSRPSDLVLSYGVMVHPAETDASLLLLLLLHIAINVSV